MSPWHILEPAAPDWSERVDALWAGLDRSGGLVVPAHFVKSAFVRMGGMLAADDAGSIGLLFPRALVGGHRLYTLRLQGPGDPAALAALIAPNQMVLHDPARPGGHTYQPTHAEVGELNLGAPDSVELEAIRALYGAIWGVGATAAYPADLHSVEFGPATSLVARRNGVLAGFLLGFYRFELTALAELGLPYRLGLGIESQVMGVAPAARRSGLAATLKRAQARRAIASGLDLIHWTADPLQYPNGALNFGRLRALAGEFYQDYYRFQNELNRVPASRLGIVWLPRSAHGRTGLEDGPRGRNDLARFPGVAVLNDGTEPLTPPAGAPYLALEIPPDWTALQRDNLALAVRWRAVSDELLARHIGFAPGRYVITDVAAEGERRYLVAHRYDRDLLLP